MFSGKEYFKMFVDFPRKEIFYDRNKDELFYLDKNEVKDDYVRLQLAVKDIKGTNYVRFDRFSEEYLLEVFKRFAIEKGLEDCHTLSEIKKAAKKNGLYDELVDYSYPHFAYEIYVDSIKNNIVEKESSKEIYNKISDFLCEIRDGHYENHYSDKNLFRVNKNGERVLFVMLGNADKVHGVNIFPSDNDEDVYKQFFTLSDSNVDKITALSLFELISFYFDDESEKTFVSNPYSKGLSSAVLYPGRHMINYLPESLGRYCVFVLENILSVLKEVTHEYILDEIDTDSFDLIDYDEDSKDISLPYWVSSQHDEEEFLETDEFYYDFSEDNIYQLEKVKVHRNAKWSFTIRRMEDYFLVDQSNDRYCRYAYLAVLANEVDETIVAMILSDIKTPRPLEGLAKGIIEKVIKIGLAKTIIVNNELDYLFFYEMFDNLIEDYDIDVQFIGKETVADQAYEVFKNEFKDDDGDIDA